MYARGSGGASFAQVAARFRAELDKMRETAAKLQQEVDALRSSADGMTGHPNFGDPNIVGVGKVGPKHEKVITPTQKLITDIQGGIAAGEEALRLAAQRYEDADNRGSDKAQQAVTNALEQKGFEEDPEYPGRGMRAV